MSFRRALVSTLALAGLALGCAAPPPACRPSSAPPVPVAVVAPALEVSGESGAPATTPRASLCWEKGRPAPRLRKPDVGVCNAFDRKVMARVEARIKKDLVITDKPSKLVIDYGCDGAWGAPRDVFFEDGSGHGGTLRVVRFHRESDRVAVRMIASSHYYGKGTEVRAGDIDVHTFDKLVETARVSVVAKPHVIRLLATDGSLGLGGFGMSSNDFHLRLTIIDDEARITDGEFTGYDGSASQEQIIPMRIATEGWQKLLDTSPLAVVPATDADRVMLTERFLVTMEREPYWWIRERYVALMAELGTIDAVPALVPIVAAKTKTDGSTERSREAAIEAITAITGWNARQGPRGTTRTTPEAAAAIAGECTL